MMETLWLAGMLFAHLWGASNANVDVPDGGTVISGARVLSTETRTVSGPPILSKVPYVNRLFRQVGYSRHTNGTHVAVGGALLAAANADAVTLIPMQPWSADKIEDRATTPIRAPIKAGERAYCDEPPTQDEILRALPPVARGIPYVYDQYRAEVEFTVEKLVDRVDPPRFFPLIGPAQLHHCHWKCTIYYTDVVEMTHPYAFKSKTRRTEVVYIDKDHLHLCVAQHDGAAETAKAMMNCPAGHFRPMPTPERVQVPKAVNNVGGEETAEPPILPTVPVSRKPERRVAPPDIVRLDCPALVTKNKAEVNVANIRGEHLVRPDGTMTLGIYGSVHVKGKTIAEIKCVVEKHLGEYLLNPQISVELAAYNSRKVYVIVDDGNGQQVTALAAEEQTVLDALVSAKALQAGTLRKIRLARIPADNYGKHVELPVDWNAITERGQTTTNYQLEPGDRVYVFVEPLKVEPPSATMTMQDVIKMAKAGVAQKIILRQMELTGAVFNLTAEDIVHLREQGVSNRLISAMQERRAEAVNKSSDPMVRMEQLFIDSENLRQLQDEVRRFWMHDPSPLTPYRNHDGETPRHAKSDATKVVSAVVSAWQSEIQNAEDIVNKGKRLPGLAGRVILYSDAKESIEASGSLHVEMYDKTSNTPVKLAEWRFDAEALRSLKRTDTVGMGCTLFLPWEDYRPEITQVELRVLYMPDDGGQPQHAEPQVVRVKTSGRRITVPMLEPVKALDFGFPIMRSPADRAQLFSFWVGLFR